MEFGKHLGKGMWGLADKLLPVVYGLAYVLLVIRVLPEEEFGNFVLVQELFLVISGLATGFALQPLLKFASEDAADIGTYVAIALVLNSGFLLLCALPIVFFDAPISRLLNSASLQPLLMYVPAMLIASHPRNFCLVLLQTRFRVQEVFWVDAIHFLGAPLLIWIWSRLHIFNSAIDLLNINLISLSCSSVAALVSSRDLISVRFSFVRSEWKKMWDYGSYSVGSTISAFIITKSDTFVLAAYGGVVQVAVYNSVKTFIRVYDMLTQAVAMFVFPASSRLASQGDSARLRAMIEKAILFATLMMVPVFLGFLIMPVFLVEIYGGKYVAAAPILRVFSLAALTVSAAAVAGNVLMGLGHARLMFYILLQQLAITLVGFLLLIPWLGGVGAAITYVITSVTGTAISLIYLNRYVPLSLGAILRRTKDIVVFMKARFLSPSRTS
jgi:O-antigen/teichoic acid export membrane protein